MPHPCLAGPDDPSVPIHLVSAESWPAIRDALPPPARAFAESADFQPKPGRHLLLPGSDGGLAGILFGLEADPALADPLATGALATALPPGTYRFAAPPPDPTVATLAVLLGHYRFTRYREVGEPRPVSLVPPDGIDADEVGRIADAVAAGRDLVNMPANDLGPDEIEEAIRRLAERHGAAVEVTAGDDLLDANLPMIHAVGRASERAPRLVDLTWGRADGPAVTIVGKGVVFDTGGLDIKPSAGMLLMKKDMGGAAAALALADMVMGANLPVRLRLLVPTVENAISGAAFRPGDVLRSRKGLAVEIGNTDAEGRLILADALALADEDAPDLLVDFATLTGAARVALGPDLPAAFTRDDALGAAMEATGRAVADPVWRLPLWRPYGRMIESKIADINNAGTGGFAGAITAALFLDRFVSRAAAHVHFDIYAWNPSGRPGRPEGGEVQGARLMYALLKTRYGLG